MSMSDLSSVCGHGPLQQQPGGAHRGHGRGLLLQDLLRQDHSDRVHLPGQRWALLIVFLSLNSLVSAADGCLQYYTGVAGRVESFNYNMAAGLQLSDTDYSVCVRMERNFCGSISVFLVLTRRIINSFSLLIILLGCTHAAYDVHVARYPVHGLQWQPHPGHTHQS